MKEYQTLLVETHGRITRVTLNRPDKLNAVSEVMHEELSRVFRDLAEDTTTDLIVLTGAGRAFSAGGDADYLRRMHDDEEVIEEVTRQGRAIVMSLLDLNVPIIAAVNGDAVGLGCSIALACDCVIAADTARFGDPHVRMGLVAGDGGAVFWPLLVGPARAKEYLLTGRLLSASEAERIGLVNRAVTADTLWDEVNALAAAILANPLAAVRGTKRAINRAIVAEAAATLEFSLSLEAQSMRSADFAEAVAAFIEKRKPVYRAR
ncbi:MAG: enoyl-CoA hydratase/isomerase family protein [Dehalococcoidia bacterium]